MNAHFEIVTTDAEQPHHVRVIADNGEPLLTSENLEHMLDAEHVVLLVAQMFGAFSPEIPAPHDGQSHVFGGRRAVGIVYTDERSAPVPVHDDTFADLVKEANREGLTQRAAKRTPRKPRKTAAKRTTKPRAK